MNAVYNDFIAYRWNKGKEDELILTAYLKDDSEYQSFHIIKDNEEYYIFVLMKENLQATYGEKLSKLKVLMLKDIYYNDGYEQFKESALNILYGQI